MWSSNSKAESVGLLPGRKTLGPLFLMITTPVFALVLWYCLVELDGSFVTFYQLIQEVGLKEAMLMCWQTPSWYEYKILAVYSVFELALMKFPAAIVEGPVTPKGHVPKYLDNGMSAYVITMAVAGVLHFTDVFPLQTVYDHFHGMLSAQVIIMPTVCVLLYLKGVFAPTSVDNYDSGNAVFDIYWGRELYPRIFGFDVKIFSNCRFGMMSWPLLLLAYAAKQYELYGFVSDSMLVSIGIQFVYLTKFYWWEAGYFRSMDIAHDAAGFYLVFGCCAWLPVVYTSHSLYLVKHPVVWGWPLAGAIFAAGTVSVLINYWADKQRQDFRSTNGQLKIWGKDPVIVRAEYQTEEGEFKKSILLASGWWGVARHFHYVPEVLGAFFWTFPGGFGSLLQYFYVIFLVILLTDRAFRDDARCRSKYGKYWDEYCELVPYRIVPYLI
ncbi:7-dehydrocholesterol reductase [Thecamonas trahens ATCC 50062]|uniref:7-dehydrocholesterol reductase n=1 Tax=Thecamonas trahens ATCC 50062 TaxID=461836 RepID=A0A0L0DJD9_THETB|nr:7-dehydrocholesterol reductase [Thecamonas trahens ATCC 50062]KNC52320.1 7-dehydrocholesterol reductase [Thecamonas trahens ATCC 50062]|eukprot:XP_013762316.1 7-dehydrocholesterol reductase [Thecamonas trahens ATCC 50062]